MKFLVVVVLLVAATGVLAQNPYEYVDDALIQRVGQIVYEYDQKVAASRSGGNAGGVNVNNGAGYQVGKPEGVSRVSNFDYNSANTRRAVPQVQPQQQNVYQQRPVSRAVQQPIMQQQQVYQQRPASRSVQQPIVQPAMQQQQAVYQQRPVSRSVQQPIVQQQQQVYQNNRNQFVPSAPVPRTFQEPEVVQKSSGFGYVLSEPEIIQRVAEFHFTDGEQDSQSQSQDSFRGSRTEFRRH
ncbi:unnamed protein product [Orchesella dallaii]|uniref:Uncharacterized protein n=1 Tax=Orchesella dallaii TaxID=48710 RepID=A0ABP1QDB6_9HEXA